MPHVSLPSFGLETEQGEDDDGLGYYPDGTKRTLTNEQIAIFRHSEIQDLIKLCNSETAQEETSNTSSANVAKLADGNGWQPSNDKAPRDPQSQGQQPNRSKRHSNQEVKNSINENSIGDAEDVFAQEYVSTIYPLTDECHHYTSIRQVPWDIQK